MQEDIGEAISKFGFRDFENTPYWSDFDNPNGYYVRFYYTSQTYDVLKYLQNFGYRAVIKQDIRTLDELTDYLKQIQEVNK